MNTLHVRAPFNGTSLKINSHKLLDDSFEFCYRVAQDHLFAKIIYLLDHSKFLRKLLDLIVSYFKSFYSLCHRKKSGNLVCSFIFVVMNERTWFSEFELSMKVCIDKVFICSGHRLLLTDFYSFPTNQIINISLHAVKRSNIPLLNSISKKKEELLEPGLITMACLRRCCRRRFLFFRKHKWTTNGRYTHEMQMNKCGFTQ